VQDADLGPDVSFFWVNKPINAEWPEHKNASFPVYYYFLLNLQAFLMVFLLTFRLLAILLQDIPNRNNSVAFWANFWYK
jgi:hypothetical protein